MALVLKIGDDKEMPPIPQDFPKCGNYWATDLNNDCDKKSLLTRIFNNILSEKSDCTSAGGKMHVFGALLAIPVLSIYF